MDCPICEYKGLEDDAMKCPACNADVSAYRALDAVEASFQKQKKRTLLFIILFFIAMMGCFAIYVICCINNNAEEEKAKLAVSEAAMETLSTENQQLKATVENLQAENKQLQETAVKQPKQREVTHLIKSGETLFSITKKYLGNGWLYPELASENGITDPDYITPGQILVIKL